MCSTTIDAIAASADVQADYQDACKQLEEAQKLLDFVEVCETVSKHGSW